jgi:hypothetical protein
MMKKVLVGAMAFSIPFASNPASAELLKNFKLSGQLDVQATAAKNVTDFSTYANVPAAAANNDRIGDAQTRLMVHMDWDLLDDVHARVTLGKNNRSYGTAGGNAHGNNTPAETIGAGGIQAATFVDEASVKIDKIAGQVDTTWGRQFYGDSGDIVIYYGPSDKARWGMPIMAIDAMRADWNSEWVAVTGVVGKTAGTAIAVTPQPDTDVRGMNILFKGNESFFASLYGWNRLTHAAGATGVAPANNAGGGGKNDSLYVVGMKFKLMGGGFWLKGEYDQNFGDNRVIAGVASTDFAVASHYNGWAAMGNTGWRGESDSMGSFALWGEYAIGSGRSSTRESRNDAFTPINGDYRPGSIYGRFANVLGTALFNTINLTDQTAANSFVSSPNLSNRMIWGAGVKMSPAVANKLTLAASWWDFRMHRFATTPQGTSLAGNGREPYNGNRHIGAELDLDLIWTHSENVAFATGWATFQPGGLIQQAAQNNDGGVRSGAPATQGSGQGVNPVTLAYFDVRVKF